MDERARLDELLDTFAGACESVLNASWQNMRSETRAAISRRAEIADAIRALFAERSADPIFAKVGDLLRTQDNRATAHPIFAVQQRVRIYGFTSDYTERSVYVNSEGGESSRPRKGFRKVGYRDEWEFVTACFTEQGCTDYIAINGHNLKDPRIYAYGGWRNAEWIALSDAMKAGAERSADSERLRGALERIVGMCDVSGRCTCGRPNGIPAVVVCAKKALDAAHTGQKGAQS